MIGITENNRGRYKCNYCSHTTYKTWVGANNHVTESHPLELERDRALERAEYAEKAKAELSRQLAEATKPTAKEPLPKYWYPPALYCASCKKVTRNSGIPRGQTIEETPHSICGKETLMLVLEVD